MRPEYIPQDVWDAALAAIYVPGFPGGDLPSAVLEQDIQAIVARAIMMATERERERCALVALMFRTSHGEPGAVASNPYADVTRVAAAIRKPANSNFATIPHMGPVA
jgi:hypothetical protein